MKTIGRVPAWLKTVALAIVLTQLVTLSATADSSASVDEQFAKSMDELLEGHRGIVSAAAMNLSTNEAYYFDADRPMPTASLIKLPIMAATYRAAEQGKVDLDAVITLREEDKVPGSGILTTNFSPGAKLSLRDAIRLMIAYSDNTATNLVIDQIGLATTTESMQKLGLPNTRLHAKVYRRDTSLDVARSKEFGLGSTTSREMLSLVTSLVKGNLASSDACAEMREHLLACEDRTKVPRRIPASVKIAHKTGAVSATRCDAGVIESSAGPIVFCFLTTGNTDRSWDTENEAELLGAEFGAAIYNYFVDPQATPPAAAARILRTGDDGSLVESLQRTLNSRLTPSPELGVDGDFGPNTQAAVIRFQKQAGVEATGEVGPDTWRSLGPLLTQDSPVESPEQIRASPTYKTAQAEMSGPPLVTCKAYAIADAKTGKVLWGYNDALQRDPASITKIMTAYLVTTLAEQDATVREETLTFSILADETSGSTSGVRANEQLKVADALYGLMLPSGNDMSVALAEHFGARFAAEEPCEDPYQAFISEMNSQAELLGMSSTSYANPHGLTAPEHSTTARDMVKLAYSALAQPLFRQVVDTPTWGCTLDSIDGYQRNVKWRNTNRLLGTHGYYGVKTGTTGPAGACLVSAGRRGNTDLIVVVLGSTSGDARYTDTRNLFRWAWNQLGAE